MSVYKPYDEVVLTEPVVFYHHPGQPHSEEIVLKPGEVVLISHQEALYRWCLVAERMSMHPSSPGLGVWFAAQGVLAAHFHHKHPLMRLASET